MRRIKRAELRKINTKKSKLFVRLLGYIVAFLLMSFGYFLFKTNFWGDERKLIVVFSGVDEGVRVVVFEPSNNKISNFFIPGDTEVEVSRGLGKWKLKSVWNLGTNEGVGGGVLLSETITKHVGIPVFIYSDALGYGLINGGIKSSLLSIFTSYQTNMSLGDRIGIWFFKLGIKNTKMTETDLSKTSFLKPKVLADGTNGYVVSDVPPQSTLAVFAEPEIFSRYPKFSIVDNTGLPGFSEQFSRVVEVLGGKVLSVERGTSQEGGCTVRSKSKLISQKFMFLFGCMQGRPQESSFDTEVSFGREFAESY